MLKIARNRYVPFKNVENVAQLLRSPAVVAMFVEIVEIVEYLIFNPTGRTGVNIALARDHMAWQKQPADCRTIKQLK